MKGALEKEGGSRRSQRQAARYVRLRLVQGCERKANDFYLMMVLRTLYKRTSNEGADSF